MGVLGSESNLEARFCLPDKTACGAEPEEGAGV